MDDAWQGLRTNGSMDPGVIDPQGQGKDLSMSTSKLIRWSGLASVLAGLWTMVTPFAPVGSDQMAYFALGTILMVFTDTGVYAAQVRESGWWGFAGYVGVIIGEVLFMVEGSPQDPIGVLAGMLYAVGLLALAVGTWRGGVFSKRAPSLWLAAIVIGIPGYGIVALTDVLTAIASLAFSLGFVLAGYELFGMKQTG
jgi:hypothetical protein